MSLHIRPIDPRAEAIVAAALAQRFKILPCERCGGPEIFSKVKPLAKCFGCGRRRELAAIAPVKRPWQCSSCRKRFYAVFGSDKCPKCQAKSKADARAKGKGWTYADSPQKVQSLRPSEVPVSDGSPTLAIDRES